jgi:hypothetical protein
MKLEIKHFVQLSPVFISSFMLLSSVFSGDVKAFIWLALSIVGIVIIFLLQQTSLFQDKVPVAIPIQDNCADPLIPLFTNFPNLSVSTFFIVFTFAYLVQPMIMNQDWNYYVVVGFLGILAMDTMVKFQLFPNCTRRSGILSGTVFGILYSMVCYNGILAAGGDRLLYFNTVSSNNVYCSRPKKQTFKCYVYKNGSIVSAV